MLLPGSSSVRLGNGSKSVAILLWGIAFFFLASMSSAVEPPTPEGLEWRLESLDSGEILWTGQLPPAEPRSLVPWQAEAVWTSASDPATTRLLARTGRILTEFRVNHTLPLSTLGPPPGPGTVALRFERLHDLELTAWAFTADPMEDDRSGEELLGELEEDWNVAANYGVRRPETRALIAIGSIYVPLAKQHRQSRDRWLGWFAAMAQSESEVLAQARFQSAFWTGIPDPPTQRLRWQGGRLESAIHSPGGIRWRPVILVGLSGRIGPTDLDLIKAMGFNMIAPEETTDALRHAAERLNIVLLEDLPAGVPIRQLAVGESFQAGHPVQILTGWEPYDPEIEQPLADHPDRLWRAALDALRIRRGEQPVSLPPGPQLEF